MRRTLPFLVSVLVTSSPLAAQQPSAPVATGSVTGHVYCSDTRQPGRLASVVLQPVVTPDILPSKTNARSVALPPQVVTSVVQTLMDGSFTITNVTPGDYYVIAELPGYLSPLSIFTRDELNHPTKQTADQMAGLLTPVTVAASSSTRADVSLIKGASIAGMVRFEDGMPDERSRVTLMRRDPTGTMKNYNPTTLAADMVKTDDQGRFRFAGLPPGEYTMYTVLAIQSGFAFDDKNGWHGGMNSSASDPSWLNIYFGSAFRERDSKSITITGSEFSGGDDIEVPLSKLHGVSGSVVDAATGAAVNHATVRILFTTLGSHGGATQVGRTEVGADGSFHFPFVPEGVYNLNVRDAREVTEVNEPLRLPADAPFQIVLRPGSNEMPTQTVQKTAKTYGDASQPLAVVGEMTGVTVQVAVKPAVAAAQ